MTEDVTTPVSSITPAPAPPIGVENLKKAVKFAIDLGQQIDVSFKDGYQWTDLFSFIDELSQAPALVKSGAQILAELRGLNDAERDELNAYVKANFDIPDDRVQGIIEDAASIVFSIVSLITQLKTPAATV